jgi:deferrochelatase/peroxidase EfeB
VGVERLSLMWNAYGESIEHFGFVDGRSQPRFLSFDSDEDEDINRTHDWSAAGSLRNLLVADPLSHRGGAGSYLVLRKLEQNVRAFKEAEATLARGLGRDPASDLTAGALIVGRDRLGRPVGTPANAPVVPVDNGFQHSAVCPVAAHTRLMNQRGRPGVAPLARRSMPYGYRAVHPDDAREPSDYPTGGVGLLFMANVSDIGGQFETLQRRANGDPGGNFDPVIGQGTHPLQSWPDPLTGASWQQSIGGYVTMLGGEYLFMPSLSGLARI